jgi:hypothetical protein
MYEGMDDWMDRNVDTNINLFCKKSRFKVLLLIQSVILINIQYEVKRIEENIKTNILM